LALTRSCVEDRGEGEDIRPVGPTSGDSPSTFAEQPGGSPFGSLYGFDVDVARPLVESDEIAFNAGPHTEFIKMSCGDFERLVKPEVVEISTTP